jgi:4-azaleucine resistance transporter AzlC
MENNTSRHSVFLAALKFSIPVFFGYIAIGIAFGLIMSDSGFPWWLTFLMSLVIYAGAAQFLTAGFFAAGTGILEAALIQLAVNARHMAYGFSMLNRFKNAGLYRFYLIFGLTDETFALLSSFEPADTMGEKERAKFMFYLTALDQFYWIAGSVLGAIAGSLIPFSTEGIGFALTALFVVLMIEKMLTQRNPFIFICSAITAVLCAYFLPSRISILAALAVSLVLSSAANGKKRREEQ